MRRVIPGVMDLEALTALTGRDLHRPDNKAVLAGEARALARSGLKPRDIAEALGLTEPAVVQALADSHADAAEIR